MCVDTPVSTDASSVVESRNGVSPVVESRNGVSSVVESGNGVSPVVENGDRDTTHMHLASIDPQAPTTQRTLGVDSSTVRQMNDGRQETGPLSRC